MLKAALSLLILLALPLAAQQGTGTISGTVTDAQDAVVTGADVEVANLDTGAVFHAKANDQGFYIAPGMAVGRYEVRASMAGFKKAVRTGIVLQVNQNLQVNVPLQVGQLVESVEVSGQATAVSGSPRSASTAVPTR